MWLLNQKNMLENKVEDPFNKYIEKEAESMVSSFSTTSTSTITQRCCCFNKNSNSNKSKKVYTQKKLRKARKMQRLQLKKIQIRSRSKEAQSNELFRQQILQEFCCICGHSNALSDVSATNGLQKQVRKANCAISSTSLFKFARDGSLFSSFRRKNNAVKTKFKANSDSQLHYNTGDSVFNLHMPNVYDSFHYYGIPLQAPVANYEFLRPPLHCKTSTSWLDLSQEHRAVVLAIGKNKNSNDDKDYDKRFYSLRQRLKDLKHDARESRQFQQSSTRRYQNQPTASADAKDSNRLLESTSQISANFEELRGVLRVHLRRNDDVQLGLGIAGGSDRQFPPSISYLRPGFIAHRSDQLQVGDRLIGVNGIRVGTLTHNEIMTLLRNAGPKITLEIEYDLNATCFRHLSTKTGCLATVEKCADILLKNDENESIENFCNSSALDDNNKENAKYTKQRILTLQSLYGVTLRGGAYGPDLRKSRPITITSIRQGGPAHREGRLRVGDRVLAVDGVDVSLATLASAQGLLRKACHSVQLTIAYKVSVLATLKEARGPLLLEIEKTPGVHFGVILAIRRHLKNVVENLSIVNSHSQINSAKKSNNFFDDEATRPKKHVVVVEEIIPASVADRCGAIHVGDEIRAVDGINLEYTTLDEVYQLLKSQYAVLRLELVPFSQILNSGDSNLKPYVEQALLNRESSVFYDYMDREQLQKQNPITSERYGQDAAKSLRDLNANEVNEFFLRQQRYNSSPPEDPTVHRSPFLYEHRVAPAYTNGLIYGTPPMRRRRIVPSVSISPSAGDAQSRWCFSQPCSQTQFSSRYKRHELAFSNPTSHRLFSSPAGLAKFPRTSVTTNFQSPGTKPLLNGSLPELAATASTGQICHSEKMEVVLHSTSPAQHSPLPLRREFAGLQFVGHCRTFGIELAYGNNTSSTVLSTSINENSSNQNVPLSPIIISAIERDSPADRCGVLQVGDRIYAINDWYTANGTIEEAHYVLRQSASFNSVTLLVEFDVIEPVLPSSEFLIVKLAKRGCNFGIVCRSETNGERGEPVFISDIRTGSVAHRCGSIQIGDTIFAIDDILLDSFTVEESMRILQQSGDVVKLCIAKRGFVNTNSEASRNVVTYSIELDRSNQPLGITIAAASYDRNTSAIVISQIAPNGLAEKTDALHIGDRIMAINGESLIGKTLRHAIHLLQQSADTVVLRIQRTVFTKNAAKEQQERPEEINQISWRHSNSSSGHHSLGHLIGINSNTALSTIPSDSVSEGGSLGKLETPLKSVDSAVESLEDSEMVNLQQKLNNDTVRSQANNCTLSYYHNDVVSNAPERRISENYPTNNGNAWDSGLSSAADAHPAQAYSTNEPVCTTTSNILNATSNECFGCGQSSSSGIVSSPGSISSKGQQGTKNLDNTLIHHEPASSTTGASSNSEEKENWMRILEALEIVGEAEMLRKLEECIMSGRIANAQCNKKVCLQNHSEYEKQYDAATISQRLPLIPLSNQTKEKKNNGILSRAIATATIDAMATADCSEIHKNYATNFPNNHINTTTVNSKSHNKPSISSQGLFKKANSPCHQPSSKVLKPLPPAHSNLASISTFLPSASTHKNNSPLLSSAFNRLCDANGTEIGINKSSLTTSSGQSTIELPPPMFPLVSSSVNATANSKKRLLVENNNANSPIAFNTSPTCSNSLITIKPSKSPNSENYSMKSLLREKTGSNCENALLCGGPLEPMHEIFNVILDKDPKTKSFGFSISDGNFANSGIYVNSVIRGGPSDGKIRPMDRVLQINGTSIQFLDCDLAVPLLAADRVEMLMLRKPPTKISEQSALVLSSFPLQRKDV